MKRDLRQNVNSQIGSFIFDNVGNSNAPIIPRVNDTTFGIDRFMILQERSKNSYKDDANKSKIFDYLNLNDEEKDFFEKGFEKEIINYSRFPNVLQDYPNYLVLNNKMIYENPNNEYTLIGLDEFGKAKPATLFFLSKNGFLGYNIKFSNTDKIKSLWDECDCWIY